MWICSRVGKQNSLSTLRQLRIYGSRYKIEKIQKLTENFEKACWRSVRISEESAYMQKYHFIKHCLRLINHHRKGRLNSIFPSKPTQDSTKLSDMVLEMYNGKNSKECLEYATSLLEQFESHMDKGPKGEHDKGSEEAKCQIKGLNFGEVTKEDIHKIKNIISTLNRRVELVEKHGNNPDVVGYSKSQLEQMIKL